MGEPSGEVFSCPACSARYALSPELAAKKIACRCGNIFFAPPLPETTPVRGQYHLAEARVEPDKRLQSASSLAELYPHRKISSYSMDGSETETPIARDRVIPILMLVIGFVLRVGEIPFDRSLSGTGLGVALIIAGFQMVLAVSLMLVGVFISAKLLSANFGSPGTAILKLCGMSMLALAAGMLVVVITQYNIRGFAIAINVMFLIHAVSFWTLFSLDLQEAILTVAICIFLQNTAAMILYLNR
jgi:hypothetical protein